MTWAVTTVTDIGWPADNRTVCTLLLFIAPKAAKENHTSTKRRVPYRLVVHFQLHSLGGVSVTLQRAIAESFADGTAVFKF